MMLQTVSNLNDAQRMYDWFERMRETQPVWKDESSGCWHVFRYDDVRTVTTDYATFSSEFRRPGRVFQRSGENQQSQARVGRNLLVMDPPDHRQYRGLVSHVFTPRAIDRLKDRVAEITRHLLNEAHKASTMDFASEVAYPLPTIVIAELLGVPSSDRPLFKRWADGLLNRQLSDAELFRPQDEQSDQQEIERFTQISEEMTDYFRQMLEDRKRTPRDDMMTDLLQASIDGEHLSMEDTISFCTILLIAGHVTTKNLLTQAIRCFDENPEALEVVLKQPDLMPGAIEEVLRYASPVWRLTRVTREDVTIAGVTIPKKSMIFAWLASANRDPAQFVEPERFLPTRPANRHVAFGHGIHFCIGAPLSRMEVAIALPIIYAQLSQLRIAHEESPTLFGGRFLFGFKHLPITFQEAGV